MRPQQRILRFLIVLTVVALLPLIAAFALFIFAVAIAIAFSGSMGANLQNHLNQPIYGVIWFFPGAYIAGSLAALVSASSASEKIAVTPAIFAALAGGLLLTRQSNSG